jgi:hypothetical protein
MRKDGESKPESSSSKPKPYLRVSSKLSPELFFGHQPSKPKLSLLFLGHFGLTVMKPATVINTLLSFYQRFPFEYLGLIVGGR